MGVCKPAVGMCSRSPGSRVLSGARSFCSRSSALRPAGDERAHADHWVAVRGGVRRELVREGEVSTEVCAAGCVPADEAAFHSFSFPAADFLAHLATF